MKKQYEVLNWASSFLKKYNREEKVAELLLQHHLNYTREQLYFNMRESINDTQILQFKKDVEDHALTGVPYQHLVGYEYFYGLKFSVNKDVLIPRQETEELVHLLIESYKGCDTALRIVDVGTGSGVIAITLALELAQASVYATDISKRALAIAKENARHLKADVGFLHGDYLSPLYDEDIKPHIIVSNPPYINRADKGMLEDTVSQYDPHLALFADHEGLFSYEQIIKQSVNNENLEGLYFEIGYDQGAAVTKLIKEAYPQANVRIEKDINGQNRIVHAKLPRE